MITRHANPNPTQNTEVHPFDYLINVHRKVLTARLRSKTLRLRLVCQAFNSALLRLRFGTSCLGAVICAHATHAQKAFNEILANDGKWKWSIARETQSLKVELTPGTFLQENSLFFEDYQVYYKWPVDSPETELSIRQTRETAAMERTAEKMGAFLGAGTLARAVEKMPKLQALSVILPEDWANVVVRESSFDDPWGYSEHYKRKLNMRLELLERVRESVAGMFRCAPGGKSLTNLTYLKLTLPCAYDFVAVEENLPDEVAGQLRHVYLEYIDGTGEGGNAKDQHPSLHAPLSNIQDLYPNDEHQSVLWKIVSRCNSLYSLGLAGTQRIEPPTSSWSGPGLKNVYMQRVAMHSEQLVKMMAREAEAVDFGDVKLVSGSWEEVFSALLCSERLINLSIKNLTYDEDGEQFFYSTAYPLSPYIYLFTERVATSLMTTPTNNPRTILLPRLPQLQPSPHQGHDMDDRHLGQSPSSRTHFSSASKRWECVESR